MTGRTLWWTRWAKGARRPLGLTMSLSGAGASAAAMQRHQEQRRADTSALVDAARGQRQMPELPPYVPEFDLAFMSQMLGGGAVRSEPEDPATGDDETMMQEAAVDIALQLFTDDGGLQALLASDEPSAERVALEGADNALANSRARLDQLYELVRASEGVTSRQIRVFSSCGTSLRSPPHAPPSGHGWFDGARRAPSNHPTPVTGSERAQPQEVPNRANSARLAAPLA